MISFLSNQALQASPAHKSTAALAVVTSVALLALGALVLSGGVSSSFSATLGGNLGAGLFLGGGGALLLFGLAASCLRARRQVQENGGGVGAPAPQITTTPTTVPPRSNMTIVEGEE